MNLVKGFYVVLGFISLGLGMIGIILPILPTTPFLLLTGFCFVKGSDRFDKWFKGTKIYKNHLESFEKNRSMTLKTKICILATADLMLLFPLILSDSLHLKIFIVLLMIFKFYYFIFRIRTVKVGESFEQNR
ncbi:YbaN family protein [Clostridium sp. B9]|uniref:YbaN family protein n=1 Tax=Clostridium sp. B9 TaxID=3423224 RepID=UPI003D2ED647